MRDDYGTLSALAAVMRLQRAPAPSRSNVKIGVLTDMSSLYADLAGAGLGRSPRTWRSRTSAAAKKRHQGRDRLGRPPEQARRRLQHRAPVVRRRQGRRDRRRAELGRRARGQPDRQATRARRSSSPAPPSSDLTGKACSPNTDPLDLRHLDARQRHRQARS